MLQTAKRDKKEIICNTVVEYDKHYFGDHNKQVGLISMIVIWDNQFLGTKPSKDALL